jgi:Protein of unknown function (DUF2829)
LVLTPNEAKEKNLFKNNALGGLVKPKTNIMNFSKALEELKLGNSVARKGWNEKNISIYLNKGSYDFSKGQDKENPNEIEGIKEDFFEKGDIGTVTRLPNLNMMLATGSTVTGWLASQTDILAEDWYIVSI